MFRVGEIIWYDQHNTSNHYLYTIILDINIESEYRIIDYFKNDFRTNHVLSEDLIENRHELYTEIFRE